MSCFYRKTGKSASLFAVFLSKMIFCQALIFFYGKRFENFPSGNFAGKYFFFTISGNFSVS
jgi:hypothetical protein